MGVSGLWDVLAPAGQSRSLANIAVVDGYEANTSGCRAFRIGIDASIWFKHAQFSKAGDNPELRLLFFRLKELAKLPLAVLFVFDGRQRPKEKRGSKMGKSGSHGLSLNFKKFIDAFGMEWREAHGEAEAELAYLNSIGVIDAVMTDDADAFVFGAKRIIRNASVSLTGNKANPALNKDGKTSKFHVMVFDAETIKKHPDIGLTRGGMVLFALLTGGDYDKGIDKFGKVVALALARCGFGDELLDAVRHRQERSLHVFFPGWRRRMNEELRTNSRGFLGRASSKLVIPDNFPRLEFLDNYACPVSSESLGTQGGGPMRGRNELNLKKVAALCEEFFEWGTKTQIVQRFRTLMWEACVIRVLRRAALEQDQREQDARHPAGIHSNGTLGIVRPTPREAIGTPFSIISKYLDMNRLDRLSEAFANREPAPRQLGPEAKPFLTKISKTRQHVSTDHILEYRVKVDPKRFVELTEAGIKGDRDERNINAPMSDGEDDDDDDNEPSASDRRKSRTAKAPVDPFSPFLMWIPASIVQDVNPELVDEYTREMEEKKQKKGRRTTSSATRGKRKPASSDEEESLSAEDYIPTQPSPPKRSKNAPAELSSASSHKSSQFPATLPREDSTLGAREGLPDHPSITRKSTQSLSTSDRSGPVLLSSQSDDTGLSTTLNRELNRSASSSFISGVSTAGDGGFPFLYKIADPDDPDLIDREDLNVAFMKQDLNWRWADLSSDNAGLGDEDEDDLDFNDDERDKQHERDFRKKIFSSSTQNPVSNRREGIAHPHPHPSVGSRAKKPSTSKQTTADPSRRLTKVSSSVLPLTSNPSQTGRPSASAVCGSFSQPAIPSRPTPDLPLFLPSPSPPQNRVSSFSQPSFSSTIDIDDGVLETPPSSQYPPSSSAGPSSPLDSRPTSSRRPRDDYAKYRAAFYT